MLLIKGTLGGNEVSSYSDVKPPKTNVENNYDEISDHLIEISQTIVASIFYNYVDNRQSSYFSALILKVETDIVIPASFDFIFYVRNKRRIVSEVNLKRKFMDKSIL